MRLTSFQVPELRDENDNIIQPGAYGKNSALVNKQNTGILDCINNNLQVLYNGFQECNFAIDEDGHVQIDEALSAQLQGYVNNASSAAHEAVASAAEALSHKDIAIFKADAAAQSATAALESANTASAKAATATSEAVRAKNEADRAEGYVNSINLGNYVETSEFVPFQGATPAANGAAGLVPAPSKAEVGKVLGANGQWIAQYSHPASGVALGTYRSVTVDNQGHVTGGSNPTLPISAGGTGATTAEAARTNLGIGNNMLVPVGTVLACAATSVPNGYLLCNGAAVSRTTYAALFSAVGTTYGAGDGSSTFNLPNLIDRFVQGSGTAGTVKEAGLPNITGAVEETYLTDIGSSFSNSSYWDDGKSLYMEGGSHINKNSDSGSSGYGKVLKFDASRSSAIYGNSVTVQPPALTLCYIIKY